MSATAVSPLFYGAIPVFVDLEDTYFCLDPAKVRAAITPKTRAILVVDLFGHPAALHELRALADEKGIYLIEDAAQAPLASEHGRFAGTIGHIGVFSLNYHKHIHTGEGGMCCTDDDLLARRLRAIRNHGENVVEHLGLTDITNCIGFNFRMTELNAAIGLEQLKKADVLVDRREEISNCLSANLTGMEGLVPPAVREGCRHVYYVWAMRFDEGAVGITREKFCEALAAEGVPVAQGYVAPLYWLPVFQQRKAIGRDGFPFTLSDRTYPKGLCPVAECLHLKELVEIHVCSLEFTDDDVRLTNEAINKVYENRHLLV